MLASNGVEVHQNPLLFKSPKLSPPRPPPGSAPNPEVFEFTLGVVHKVVAFNSFPAAASFPYKAVKEVQSASVATREPVGQSPLTSETAYQLYNLP